ncbi:MAG TPA: GNAT family N-acetyltransferase [Blastocatellia bacterium]|nr:GNAT family N-acetyltransferase [Blastocatellia bacterium]
MSFAIRALNKLDIDRVIELCSAIQPECVRDLEEYLRRFDETNCAARACLSQWAAVEDASQQLVGYAVCWNVVRRKYRMGLMVHADWRKQGVGGDLLGTILTASQSMPAATLQARAWDDQTNSLQFLRRRGFVETHRMVELLLNLSDTDLTSLAELPQRLTAQDIQFTTLRQEGQDERFWTKLTDLHQAAVIGWPDPDPDGAVTIPTGDEVRRMFDSWQTTPDTFLLAKADGMFIGYTVLGPDHRVPEAIGTGPTAVRPEYRGRGVATALKVLALTHARQRGWRTAVTRSASPAMIRVNEKLGFQRGRAEVRLVRRLIAS